MQGILLATSFTLVALIMHTDKLLLDSDLLFQKVGGNVQHTLLIEWSSCTFMKWVGMILSPSHTLFFSLTYYFVCVMCIFQHQRSPLGWKPAWGWEPNKKFSFLPSYGLFYLRQDEVLQRQRASFVSISNWQQQIHLKSNCRQPLFKRNSPFGYTSKNKRRNFTELQHTDRSSINLSGVNEQSIISRKKQQWSFFFFYQKE